uniref:Uncharacterized protein n=1 Tax=Tanacetum cinerariifolium TaxID=118510 RepID=A0A6L2KUU6_TANCI|nr:hypothetical protein [Tanacetum cinerariifolium]
MNKKSYSFDLDTSRSMLQMYPKLPGQKFVDPPFEEDILTFMRELGYSGNIKFLSDHEVVQKYGAILLDYITTQTMKESEAYMTYHDLATGKVQPKPKYVQVALTKAEQLKLATKRSLIQTHSSHASGSGEEISWKSSDEEDDDDEANIGKDKDDNDQEDDDNTDHDDDSEQTDSDNDGDDFVHPKFSTHDDEARQEEEVNEEESFDPIVQTPSQDETTDDEDNDDDSHDMNFKGDELDGEGANKEDDSNELYKDVNINLKGRQQSSSVSYRFVSNMLNPSPDTRIDSIFNLNIESTPHVDVSVNTTAEPPLLSATTLPPPSTPIIPHLQQTPIIKEQVKEQVKAQVSKIFPKLEKTVNEQLEVELLTRSSNSSKTSHKNLYKALVDAYKCEKLILDTYRDTVTLKRRRDDEDKDKEPSARSNRGSNRRRVRKEQESTSEPKEKTSKTTGNSS